jgi:hypothetical protein
MIHMEQIQGTSQDTSTWVREVLEPDQLSSAKNMQHVGRRQLKTGTVIILWTLRLYVVLMMFIIAYQIWTALQS